MKKDDTYLGPRRWTCGRATIAIVFAVLLVVNISFWRPLQKVALETPGGSTGTHDTAVGLLTQDVCRLRFWRGRLQRYCEAAEEGSWLSEEREPLEVFQVHTPPRILGEGGCERVLMQHTFAWSYGKPFVGEYTPPECEWSNVVFNLTMTSQGRQYDRLGLMFLGDVEVWRTSTAEPTPYGIVSSYSKDMTHLSALLRQPQKLIFDLGNLVNDIYTGSFNVTLTATYFEDEGEKDEPANQVLPISAARSRDDQPSHFSLPSQKATTEFTLPKNTIKAHVSISASGNADEEFYYTNVPSSYTSTFPSTTLSGHSPFREIQLLIDGELAGVAWPSPTIFTGGIVPSLWRPIVGLNAFDLPEYTIDISPLLPLLLTSTAHTAELLLVSYDEANNTISRSLGTDWLISARLHIWTDPDPHWETTGSIIQRYTPSPTFTLAPLLGEHNGTLTLTLTASRMIALIATINTSTTKSQTTTWIQSISYSSTTHLSDHGNKQFVRQHITGMDTSSIGGSRRYRYPLQFEVDFVPRKEGFELKAEIEQGVQEIGGGRTVAGELRGSASWQSGKGGVGRTEEIWADVGGREGAYARKVEAVGDEVVSDWERREAAEVESVVRGICGDCLRAEGEVGVATLGVDYEDRLAEVLEKLDIPGL